jgi:hypothetical protein
MFQPGVLSLEDLLTLSWEKCELLICGMLAAGHLTPPQALPVWQLLIYVITYTPTSCSLSYYGGVVASGEHVTLHFLLDLSWNNFGAPERLTASAEQH